MVITVYELEESNPAHPVLPNMEAINLLKNYFQTKVTFSYLNQ